MYNRAINFILVQAMALDGVNKNKKGLFEIFLNNEYIRDGKNIKKYNLPI